MSIKLPETISPEKQKELEKLLSDSEIVAGLAGRTSALAVNKRRKKGFIIAIVCCLLMIGCAVYLILDSIDVGTRAAQDRYHEVKETVSTDVYDSFYQSSFDLSEQQHHVSNEISITIGSLRDQARLEVLRISEVEYEDSKRIIEEIKKSTILDRVFGNVVSWLEVPGYGVFTVDLMSGEFIIDNERQYVLIRIPNPELSEFTIDYANVELLNFEDSGLFKNSAKVGEDLARAQLQSAELSMRQKTNANQEFYQSARNSAIIILTNLVKQLNPALPNLTVQVEFFE